MKIFSKFFKYLISIIVLILVYLTFEPLYTPTAIPTKSDMFHFPEVIAEKAMVSHDFPGNSLEAIQEVLSIPFIRGVEIDVRTSKDNILFLYGEDNLSANTNASGRPEDYSWNELSNITYKNSPSSYLLTLDEALSIIGNQKAIFINVKSNDIFNKKLVDNLVFLIKKHNLQENVYVESFNPVFLSLMRLKARDIMLMYNFIDNNTLNNNNINMPWVLKNSWLQKQIRRIVRPDILGPKSNINPTLLKSLISNNYPIITWTVNDIKSAEELYKLGVKGVKTNQPLLLENINSKNPKISYDAGDTRVMIDEMIYVLKIQDIIYGITKARINNKKVSIAARKHSMGGQSLLKNSIQLDMINFNEVQYNPTTKTVTAQAGASWKKIQEILDMHSRSVKVMQSDNIFTVGGSISVNVHGWQINSEPLASTIVSMTIITPSGELKKISKNIDPELFSLVIGGYGMFGVIVDAELETTDNASLMFRSTFITSKQLGKDFTKLIDNNSNIELAYARLSINKKNLFSEAGLFWYERSDSKTLNQNIKSENLIAIKRGIFRLSEYSNFGKNFRWFAEKSQSYINNTMVTSRNNAMNSDIHILWPIYGSYKDILHEYFVPQKELFNFILDLKNNVEAYNINLLNVTVRQVKKDTISFLPYAKNDVFALVCLFSQSKTEAGEEVMKNFTNDNITKLLNLGGSFYLPYRLHYNSTQLLKAYPQIKEWVELKKKYDPDMILSSEFFEYIYSILHSK